MSAPAGGAREGARTVLMVTYAYPPSATPGALRAVKLARYLPALGWHPVVITPQEGYASITGLPDEGQAAGARVVRTRDLGWVLRRLNPPRGATPDVAAAARPLAPPATGGRGGGRRAAVVRMLQPLAIPDRNVGWYPFAVRAAAEAVREDRPSVIFSSSPTVTNHLVAMRTAGRFGIPWVADFRDPWTLTTGYRAPAWRHPVDRALERRMVERAARIVVTSEHDVELFARAYPRLRDRLRLVRNGYDPADFAGLEGPPPHGPFTLTHAGSFYGGDRDPGALLAALAQLRAAGVLTPANFRLRLVGHPEAAVRARVAEHGVGDLVDEAGALPYAQALAALSASSAVLLLTHLHVNTIPVKFYDYVGVRRPILALTNPGFEVAEMVRRSGGSVLDLRDVDAIRGWLSQRVAGGVPDAPDGNGDAFTRQASARAMAAVLDEAAAAA